MPDDDYTPLHARFQDDTTTVDDLGDLRALDRGDVRRRLERLRDAAAVLLRDTGTCLSYMEGETDASEVWQGVRGLPSGGMTGDVDVLEMACGSLQDRARRAAQLSRDVRILMRILTTLEAANE
jgi:hypothetical protein